MIIVKKSGYLRYKNFKFRCALGKNGIKKKLKEGDNITPKGVFSIKITKNLGWCDDSTSSMYNKQIKLPSKFSHEKLYRKDNLYDLILVLNYNTKPVIKNKGSAIFIHIANKYYKKTKGCIALKKDHLIELISKIKKNTKIKIY